MKYNKDGQYSILTNNVQNLLHEYPDQEKLILECLWEFVYGLKIVDSDIINAVYTTIGTEEAKEYSMTIKVTEGW
jgi:hypothetical protein